MLVAITVVALLIPASAILLHQYRHRTLAPRESMRDTSAVPARELPKAA